MNDMDMVLQVVDSLQIFRSIFLGFWHGSLDHLPWVILASMPVASAKCLSKRCYALASTTPNP